MDPAPVGFVTPHFAWEDFRCHDGTPVPVALWPNVRRLCNTLEAVRARFGAPLVVTCGYRTPAYNAGLRKAGKGAAEYSQHMTGKAADVRPVEHADLARLKQVVEAMLHQGEAPDIGGFGEYHGWVHVDVRDKGAEGHVARWFGDGVASEP